MQSWPDVYIPQLDSRFALRQLSLFDTASGEALELPKKSLYRLYVCGITPYDATHLGHAATYLTFDLIHRYLLATGAEVRFVQNITDIDDPLLERAKRDGVDWQELAQSQIDLFRGDMTDLHVIPPQSYIGVVEAMEVITESIQVLQKAGTTYSVDNDLYYRVRTDPDFGNRSHLDDEEQLKIFAERGGDPARLGKEDPLDALIWLSQRTDEPGWPSQFGSGRPGWHIECSAIALRYLQISPQDEFSIDIQGGGSDLIFPHHEMSASQSFALTGQKFARCYVHSGMVGLDGQKMSKSLGNLVFVSKLIAQGIDPMAIRWALMGHGFQSDLMWNEGLITQAQVEIEKLRKALSRVDVAPTSDLIQSICDLLSLNLDTPAILIAIREWIVATERGSTGGEAGELSRALDTLLGLAL
jgi:L-cysteine:1D-myo-inositol 2-amino-2-deoxy-alpha-D-glucopyranoside ligase